MKIYYDKEFKCIVLEYGYACYEFLCPYYSKCKRKVSFRMHNLIASINRFLFLLHLPPFNPIIEHRPAHGNNLSGTKACPYNAPRIFSCYDCEFSKMVDYRGRCFKPEDYTTEYRSDVEFNAPCKYFKPTNYAISYNNENGDKHYITSINEIFNKN